MKIKKLLDNDVEKNRQYLVDMARNQLCRLQDREIVRHAESLKIALHLVEPELSDQMVPECVYRCGAPIKKTVNGLTEPPQSI